jgi:succinate dehydrogenase flavin-adding protein (antitoxin of CptAB toxin-antitoxin module)
MDEIRRARRERLRWHCRRALLELDLIFQRYWARVGDGIGEQDEAALERLLAMEDHDLWYLISGRTETGDPRLSGMVEQLRRIDATA